MFGEAKNLPLQFVVLWFGPDPTEQMSSFVQEKYSGFHRWIDEKRLFKLTV